MSLLEVLQMTTNAGQPQEAPLTDLLEEAASAFDEQFDITVHNVTADRIEKAWNFCGIPSTEKFGESYKELTQEEKLSAWAKHIIELIALMGRITKNPEIEKSPLPYHESPFRPPQTRSFA